MSNLSIAAKAHRDAVVDKVKVTYAGYSSDDLSDMYELGYEFARKEMEPFLERMNELAKALPPNAISMHISKALNKLNQPQPEGE